MIECYARPTPPPNPFWLFLYSCSAFLIIARYYEPCVAKMRRIFQHGESFYTTLHMRVEDDWAFYCKQKEYYSKKRNEPEKWCFGADEIANITLASEEIQGHHNFLLLYAGDKFDATNKNRRTDSMRTDPTTVRILPCPVPS